MAHRCLKQASAGSCRGIAPPAARVSGLRCRQQSSGAAFSSRQATGAAQSSRPVFAPAHPQNGIQRHQRSTGVVVRAGPEQTPGAYPWDESEYHRVDFVKEPYGPVAIDSAGSHWRGVLLFQLANDKEPVSEDTRVMEIFISGDACISIYTHMCPSDNTRPMALDILWQMWQRGRQMSKRDWTLLRVAVVACVNDVYFGRLFFGDPDTKQVHWDTDVRPSDATFLALKAGAPIYVKKSVWEACATPLRNSSTWPTVNFIRREQDMRAGSTGSSSGSGQRPGSRETEQLNPETLPAIRLLMREMEVAVREEDYSEAARLRDHPWMRLAEDINMHRSIGYYDQAVKLMSDLKTLIDAHESAVGRDYEARLSAQQEARRVLDKLLLRQEGEGSEVQPNESSKRD